ncbi:MAG TPA: hypothetical protein DCE39_21635, partial [Planctomycetaceae bacterium]|nr:hypothetical protein [Planctomycetaceae bacterium]
TAGADSGSLGLSTLGVGTLKADWQAGQRTFCPAFRLVTERTCWQDGQRKRIGIVGTVGI